MLYQKLCGIKTPVKTADHLKDKIANSQEVFNSYFPTF